MRSSFKTLKLAVATAAFVAAGAASAERPANLAGTTWTMQVNRDVLQLIIDTQAGPGAPGAETCRHINGTINTTPDIVVQGWYCVATGRIHLVHKHLRSGNAMRIFTGNVSDEVIGQPLYMAGTMTVLAIAFGDLGEYNFSATRQ
jgi:hypothetical protein